tara:strand:- start:93 stop:293 length:201 start_codon:yes stop_codon:yes gene_type:complete
MNKYVVLLSFLIFTSYSYAYIGPGMSGGVIAAILGFIAAIFLAIWGILYYPIKRAFKNRKKKKDVE